MPATILNYTTALHKLFGEVLPKTLAWYYATMETQQLSVTARHSHVSPRSHMTWPICRMRRETTSCPVCPHFVSLGIYCLLFQLAVSRVLCSPNHHLKSKKVGFGKGQYASRTVSSNQSLYSLDDCFSCHMRPGKKIDILSFLFFFFFFFFFFCSDDGCIIAAVRSSRLGTLR